MKTNRKLIIGIVIVVLILSFSGCGQSSDAVKELDMTEADKVKEAVEAATSNQADVEDNQETTSNQETANNEAEQTPTENSTQEDKESEYQDYIDLELVDKDGNSVRISDYEGKLIALNFFGIWCKYCMAEMPDFEKVYSEYEGDDFVILLVNATTTEKSKEDVIKWYEEEGLTMPMVLDLDGAAISTYPVQGYPTTYFINKEGKVLGAVTGQIDEATLLNIIETYK